MNTNKEMVAKNLAIKKLEKNNEKYVSMMVQKPMWEEYQKQLAAEKNLQKKLLAMINQKQSLEEIDRLKRNTYRDYLRNNSNFGFYDKDDPLADSAGTFFSRWSNFWL